MSSTGAGYDYSCGTFSPDGRIFQVEYATKAVENSGTAVGIRCADGIVMAVEKPLVSKMLVAGSNRRVFGVASHAGMVVTGYVADGRQIVNRARDEARSYKETYGHAIVPSVLANRLALYVHYFTTHGALRPFGTAAMLAAYDEDLKTHSLYMVEPSGNCFKYFGCAAGKGAQAAKTEVEKILYKAGSSGTEITCREAIKELARIMHVVRDPSKDKPFQLEMGWICEETEWKYGMVPQELVDAADAEGKVSVTAEGAFEESKSGSEAMEL
mmetsp:Transcript_7235/g.10766  ORF Transcript_7235/g.10766 Transcript_7235/m.10766 type:complete len:270 (-) Transcript_7235:115-924(-)|eukprot:CAMPEP_0185024274 /NCGR_PEP_ID=MMETSP1103-20130426/7279_1 /TAXON_ID=36769 /ORGANISM="Paraphysomonas bandaiensis, Strain Caron Lab Isolate" /LENGTH=269 /DNA_ID=CAMNT_0027557195 /DNA_START=43 /DNA_END=852 /DNA_ORIENTATION=-